MENQDKEISQIITSKLGWLESIKASEGEIAKLKEAIKAEKAKQRRYARYVKNLRSTLEALGQDPMAGEEGTANEQAEPTDSQD